MIVTLLSNALWQGALVVAITALVLALVPLRDAATRYVAWLLALLAVMAIPVATATSHLGAQLLAAIPHQSARAGIFSLTPVGALANDATAWLARPHAIANSAAVAIAALWIAGAALGLGRLAVSFVRIARIRRCAAPFSQVEGIPVLVSSELTIPIATGITSPAVIVPSAFARELSEHDLRCTIEHELAHVRRGDVALNAVQRIVEATLFWNPWVHVVGCQLVREREAACDDWAVRRIGEADEYALTLAALAQRITATSAFLLTPSAFGSRNALVARIERLMADQSRSGSSLNYVALGVVTVLFAVMTLALQALLPAPANASPLQATEGLAVVAATGACTKPNVDPMPIDAVAPDLPKSQWPARKVSAIVLVTIAPNGKATAARVFQSSGNANVDRAVVTAAEKSTYSPKVVNCVPVAGSYLFRADFTPRPS